MNRLPDFGRKNKKQNTQLCCARVLLAYSRFWRVETPLWLKSNAFVFIFSFADWFHIYNEVLFLVVRANCGRHPHTFAKF